MSEAADMSDPLEIAAEWVDELDALTPERRQVLETWLEASVDNASAFTRMRRLMLDSALLEAAETVRGGGPSLAAPPSDGSARRRRTGPRTMRAARPGRARMAMGGLIAAGVALIVVAAAVLSPRFSARTPLEEMAYATGVGSRSDIALSDRSVVHLNADSRVAVRFSPRARDIRLDRGEARFDVAHNPAQPFTVTAGDVSVVAVGTVFDVERVSGAVEVRVFQGAVHVAQTGRTDRLLRKGEWLMLEPDQGPTSGVFEPAGYQDWRSDWLQAENMPLKFAIVRLNRYSAEPISLDDASKANVEITGRFDLRNTSATLTMISALLKLKTVDDGKGYHLQSATMR